MTTLNHYTQKPASNAPPKQVIVLLHGYGSNGRDLISLAPYWKASAPDALFVSPDAPFPCEMGVGFQWFSLANYSPETLLAGTQAAAPILDNYLDNLLDNAGVTDKDLMLVGFSQGTMMGLYTGPRRKGQIAGVLGYSGALIGDNELVDKNKPPIHLIHGESDDVVTIDRYHHGREKLIEHGFTVTGHSTPGLTHSIDAQGIKSGADFIQKMLSDNN